MIFSRSFSFLFRLWRRISSIQALFDKTADGLRSGIDAIIETKIVNPHEKVLINHEKDLRFFAWHDFLLIYSAVICNKKIY